MGDLEGDNSCENFLKKSSKKAIKNDLVGKDFGFEPSDKSTTAHLKKFKRE